MIIYDLVCTRGHKFEGWFKDRGNYEEQKSDKLISCPLCGTTEVEMLPTTPAIRGKDLRLAETQNNQKCVSLFNALQSLHKFIEENFCDVGERFAEVALKIHAGEEEGRNIRGTVTEQEEEVLREEGVEFFKIPALKYDS